jgi:hypothetical protein
MEFRTMPAGHGKEPNYIDGVPDEDVRRAGHYSATFHSKIRRIT